MIAGIGIDLVEADRFRAAMERQGERFLKRVFTTEERRYCEGRKDPWLHYAARFAAKEAVLKALGTGWSGGIRWTDVEVARTPDGQVRVRLRGRAREAARRRRIRMIHLSLTHTSRTAAAAAAAEAGTPPPDPVPSPLLTPRDAGR